jgi:MoaA/NifB/PqqE/SkfB family radical SAM enzyme
MNNMKPESLKSQLETTFDLVCFYDLADALLQHNTVFKIFKKYHKEAFDSNQRLIFYTEHAPSQLILNHLQRAAVTVDISNFFITICTPHDITQQLKIANKQYGNDDVAISWLPFLLQDTKHLVSDNIYSFETFCAVPFGMLYMSKTLDVKPCCQYKGNVGSLNDSDLIEIFNGPLMSKLRSDIKQGIKHQNCKNCWDAEAKNATSLRDHFLDKYGNLCDQKWIDDFYIRDLTISPSNLCNFKCRICNSENSSSIAAEEIKFSTDLNKIKILKEYNSFYNTPTTDITQKVYQVVNDLQFLHILGGEPFKWQELDRLIDSLVVSGHAKNMQIEFNTNGSIFPNKIFDKLLNFKSVEILISIDDINERFELQRGGSWNKVLNNILEFKNKKTNTINIKIAPTVNIQNILYLDRLVDFCSAHNFDIVWWYLHDPQYLSIDHVTAAVKDVVYNRYINHSVPELQSIAVRMYSSPPVSGQSFINYMTKIDLRRKQNSSIVLKEIFDLMST